MSNFSRNISEQDNGDIEVDKYHEVNPIEENDDTNIIENYRLSRLIKLIHNTFSLMDGNLDEVCHVPLIDKAQKSLYKGSRTNILFSFLFYGELESIEWFVKHLSHIDPKVCNMIIHT